MSLVLLFLLPAFAEDPPATTVPTEPAPAASPAPPPPVKNRTNIYELGVRARYLAVPGGVIDPFVFPHGDDGKPARPNILAYTFGLEFVLRNKNANGIFYVEYALNGTKEGYWDDVEDPPNSFDGSWLKPERMGMVLIGANGAYEIHANSWWSWLFGGGLGLGIVTGQMTEWEPGETDGSNEHDNLDPSCGQTEPAYERAKHCGDDGPLKFPAVLPVVDINIATRFQISDRATIRLEGGLHDMFYGGMTVGVMF